MDISAAFNSIKPLHLSYLEPALSSPPRTITASGDKYDEIKRDTRRNADNDNRSRDREDTDLVFRALITPSVIGSADQYFEIEKETSKADGGPHYLTRISKFPDDASKELLSEDDSHNYYYSTRSYSGNTVATDIFRTAAMSYAQNYVSVSGTFARAGESLELTA